MRTALLVLALLATPATAATLRCGAAIVSDGDPMAVVASKCGEPQSKSTRTERTPATPNADRNNPREMIVKTIDTWIYNFGPGKFMQQVVFVNGVLTEVTSLGYGKKRARRDSNPRPSA